MAIENDSPAAFLAELGETLIAQREIDADLARILKIHILTDSASKKAVDSAFQEVVALASGRATAVKE